MSNGTATQQNSSDDLDEVLVKEPDGTFRVVKVAQSVPVPIASPQKPAAPITKHGVVTGQVLPRVEKPAPAAKVLEIDEEKELVSVMEKAKTFVPQEKDSAEERVRKAFQESGVALSDPSLASRLMAILIAYVKQVRNDMETRELLTRTKESGGLAMTMTEATRLLTLLQTPITNPPAGGVVTGPVRNVISNGAGQAPQPKPSIPPPPAVQKPAMPPAPVTKPDIKPPVPAQRFAPPPAPLQKSLPQVKVTEVKLPPPLRPAPPKPPPPSAQEVARPLTTDSSSAAKPLIQDVTFTHKLVGPVGELQMSIADWRRMAPTVKDRGLKIEEKLRLLEEESYAERLKGIAAWHESEVVRCYQDVGRESLITGKPIDAVLTERQAPITNPPAGGVVTGQAAGKQTISMEEFQAVAEVNEKLRF